MSNEVEAQGYNEPALFTAAQLLDWRRKSGNYPLPRLPEAAILTHQNSLLPKRPWLSRHAGRGLSFEVRNLQDGVTLVGCRGVGGPATAVVIEELAVLGVHRLVAIDIAGSLDASIPSGSIVIVQGALTADGASKHYGREAIVSADAKLTEALSTALTGVGVEFSTGLVWSTDAVYRETPSLIATHRSQGAVLVDMDTAAVLAVSASLGIEAAAVLVAADELYEAWRPPRDMRFVRSQLQRLLRVAATYLHKK